MSKAEEEAIKRYPKIGLYDNLMKRKGFIEGYQQAEKDLELTWEDMRELHIIFESLDVDIELSRSKLREETLGYYEEVLKRFKELKCE